ncbi:MAG: TonB-dependent receptor [Balneolaceae bacterium]
MITVISIPSVTAYSFNFSDETADTTDIMQKIYLERIMVVGTPAWVNQIPGAASYISPEQMQRHQYTDIHRVLRSVSGVNIQEEDGFGLRPNIGLRGAGVERSSKINIMEDGILAAPAPYSAPAAYYFPNMGRINSVEVRKGSSQIKYGPNTTGGAINLISTPIPAEFTGLAELSIGDHNSNKMYGLIGNTYKNIGFAVEALSMNNDGFKNLDNGANTGYSINDFLGKVMIRSDADASFYQRLELKMGFNNQTSDETYLGLTREDFDKTPLRRYAGSQADQINTEHLQFMLRHFALLSDHIDITSTIYHTDFSRNWYKLQSVNGTNPASVLMNPSQYDGALQVLKGGNSDDNALSVRSNNRKYFSQGIESIVALRVGSDNINQDLQFGIRLHRDEEDRFQFEDGYRMENGTMILTNAGTPGSQANRIGSATALSLYVQNIIRYNDWTFTPGIRYENIWFENLNYGNMDFNRSGTDLKENEYTIQEFIPGIGVTYHLHNHLTLISGIHKGFSPPSPGSSSDTKSEQSINYELGLRYSDSLIKSEIIGFYNNYSNLLGSDLAAGGGSGTTAQFNAGEVQVLGLELSSSVDLADIFSPGSLSLPLSVNYTFTNATFQSDFKSNFSPWGSVSKGDEIPFIPVHQLNSSLGMDLNQLGIFLSAIYSPAMRTIAGSGTNDPNHATDSYLVFDISSDYQLHNNVSLFLNVRNLLNNHYIVSDRPAGVRPGLPRTLIGGLKVTL